MLVIFFIAVIISTSKMGILGIEININYFLIEAKSKSKQEKEKEKMVVKNATRVTGPKISTKKRKQMEEANPEKQKKVRMVRKKVHLKKRYEGIVGPRSAFQLYVKTMAKRHNVDGNKNLNATEIEPKWRDVTDKSEYKKLEAEDLKRWLKEIWETRNHEFTPDEQIKYYDVLKEIGYELAPLDEIKKTIKKKKTPPFFLYLIANRKRVIDEHNGKITNDELLKLLGKRWAEMSDTEKEPWNKKSQQQLDNN